MPDPTLLRNATLPAALTPASAGRLDRVDITLCDGVITGIAPSGSPVPEGATVHDCDGGLVFPAFVDLHTHLDKGHIWPRRPSPDGSFMGALTAVMADRDANWSADDVERRMEFALRCAYAHGTAAIRTHLDSAPPQGAITWPVFDHLRARWAGRIELQAVALLGPDALLDRGLVRSAGAACAISATSSASRWSPASRRRACSTWSARTSSRWRTPMAPTASSSKPRSR